MKKRKVCFVITSKIHYGRSKLVLLHLRKRADVELSIVVAASALLDMYGNVLDDLERDGFAVNNKIVMTLEGGNTVAMAKTAGVGIMEFTTAFDNLKPDIVVVRGDRYEVLSAAVAAAYLNIPVAHLEGGDVSGTIDESVRHAISKLSHIHFPTNEQSAERIIRMGENPKYVFNVGATDIEFVARNRFRVSEKLINQLGVGDVVDIDKPFLIAMQHPVTSEIGANRAHLTETLEAVRSLNIPTVWFWPNVDAGADEVSKAIREFRELKKPHHMRFLKHLPPEQFIGLLKRASCLVGNSSAGIKECSYLGVPVVNIGTRQNRRMRAGNVVDVGYGKAEIKRAIKRQVSHGPYEPSSIYYKKGTSAKIAQTLAKIKLYSQKKFVD
ncbi:MAG: UDP-N-acetylglucosamine 2-epimerase (hydrolyzing) [Parcubacteria group bacterium]|nr:UDP-N-acetylglucosamine 2-epimerase (hydrolyzing) [Parcubacteria group bacterium]